ncbi:MAG TPA: inorganic diphosphatase [Povalibacter sp.]
MGVPVTKVNPPSLRSLRDLDPRTLDELEHFFVSYNVQQGRQFKPLGRLGAREAMALIDAAVAG